MVKIQEADGNMRGFIRSKHTYNCLLLLAQTNHMSELGVTSFVEGTAKGIDAGRGEGLGLIM